MKNQGEDSGPCVKNRGEDLGPCVVLLRFESSPSSIVLGLSSCNHLLLKSITRLLMF